MNFLINLKKRNPILYWFGWFNFLVGLGCLAGMMVDDRQLLGVSRWLKPFKFYFSVGVLSWTLGWLMNYLGKPGRIKWYSLVISFSLFFENGLILLQSARGTTSHFNNATAFDGIVFALMGLLILIFTITSMLILVDFFRRKDFGIQASYLWGIRLGLLFFIIFSIEGGMMLRNMGHTVGAPDGLPGIPLLNWSKSHGDLRVAHFLGIHALQILPLAGFYLAKTKWQIIGMGGFYFLVVSWVFIRAMNGIPFFV